MTARSPKSCDLDFVNDFGEPEMRAEEIARLAREVNQCLQAPLAREIGTFRPGPDDHDGHPVAWPGLRSACVAGFGGGEYHHNIGSSDVGVLTGRYVAANLDRHLTGLEWHRAEAIASVGEARTRAMSSIAACNDGFRPPRLVAVCFSATAPGDVRIGLDLEMLGNDLVRRVFPLRRRSPGREQAELADALEAHERRARCLAELQVNRCRGRVEETTRLVAASAGLDLEEALRRLHRRNDLPFRFHRGRYSARLYWRDGVVRCDVHDQATGNGLCDGELMFGEALPDSVFEALPGRRLGEVAAIENPHLPPDAMITEVHERGGTRFIKVMVPTTALPNAPGA